MDDSLRTVVSGVAWASIDQGLARGTAMTVDPGAYAPDLQRPGACFVTLYQGNRLRGCMGNLSASQALVCDVAANAYSAAFHDPRFPPLTTDERDGLVLSVSVLSVPERMSFTDENDLIRSLRPGKDGLILSEGRRRGTFLPAVWESLPEPAMFLAQLKQKAGLPPDYWSPTIEVQRYTTETW